MTPVIAIIDAGKTNKKLLLFDEQYKLVFEQTTRLEETIDEDGESCEDVHALTGWVHAVLDQLGSTTEFNIKAINFSGYGASFVHINKDGKPFLPLYSYLKPYPDYLKKQFFETYGGEKKMLRETASPLLGHLNSGLLLYRLKYEKDLLNHEGYSLHLPQFLSFLVTGKPFSDITSIGCHTMLWNFEKNDYHHWVHKEGIDKRLAPVFSAVETLDVNLNGHAIKAGIGLHDSSSALIPYLASFDVPFVLISTGTWAISMNPFNNSPLTDSELDQDCLCYMTYQKRPVKSSRLFAGRMHEDGVNTIAQHFNVGNDFYKEITYNQSVIDELGSGHTGYDPKNLGVYEDVEEAYHGLLLDIIRKQVASTNLVMSPEVKKIFVDGGFGRNNIFMKLLAQAYPDREVYAADVPQATAMGAALAIHQHWNRGEVPADVVTLHQIHPL